MAAEKEESLLNTERVSLSLCATYQLAILTTWVPHLCIHYTDFEVIYAHMRSHCVPGPLLRACKRAWVRG